MTWYGCKISLITEFSGVSSLVCVSIFFHVCISCEMYRTYAYTVFIPCKYDYFVALWLNGPFFALMLWPNQKPLCFLLRTLYTNTCADDDDITKSSLTLNTFFIDPYVGLTPILLILLSNE